MARTDAAGTLFSSSSKSAASRSGVPRSSKHEQPVAEWRALAGAAFDGVEAGLSEQRPPFARPGLEASGANDRTPGLGAVAGAARLVNAHPASHPLHGPDDAIGLERFRTSVAASAADRRPASCAAHREENGAAPFGTCVRAIARNDRRLAGERRAAIPATRRRVSTADQLVEHRRRSEWSASPRTPCGPSFGQEAQHQAPGRSRCRQARRRSANAAQQHGPYRGSPADFRGRTPTLSCSSRQYRSAAATDECGEQRISGAPSPAHPRCKPAPRRTPTDNHAADDDVGAERPGVSRARTSPCEDMQHSRRIQAPAWSSARLSNGAANRIRDVRGESTSSAGSTKQPSEDPAKRQMKAIPWRAPDEHADPDRRRVTSGSAGLGLDIGRRTVAPGWPLTAARQGHGTPATPRSPWPLLPHLR